MKLLFIIFKYFPYGGLQLDFYRIVKEATRRGHKITILTSQWEDEFIEGIDYHFIHPHALSNHRFALEFEKLTLEYLKKESFDLVCGFNRIAGLDVYFANDNCFRTHSKNKKWFQRCFTSRYKIFERLENNILSPQAKTKIFYMAEQQKKDYIKEYNTQNERFYCLPFGLVQSKKFPKEQVHEINQEVRKEFNISEEKIVLIQICSSFYTKGVDRNLYALSSLPEEIRQKCIFLVVGRDNPKKISKLVKKLKLENQVIFTCGRTDVERILLCANLMIHPARNEAGGIVLIEALAEYVPVLCTKNCGYSQFVQEAKNYVLDVPFNQKAYNEALLSLLQNNSLLEQLKFNVTQYAQKTDFYSRHTIAVDYLEKFGLESSIN